MTEPDTPAAAPATTVPQTPDGLTVAWDASPSECDGNGKRLYSATVGNDTPEILALRMRILDPAGNFVHQSHVYAAPVAEETAVDLGGIPAGQSTVQIIDESTDTALAQTEVTFEGC